MKALLVNTPASAQFRGGDTTQMVKTAEGLRVLGVETAISTDAEPDARGFDIAHVFNLRTIPATSKQVQALKRTGVPIVMSPIYLNPGYALWATEIIRNIFGQPRSEKELTSLLDQFKSHSLRIKKPSGAEIGPDSQTRGSPTYDADQRTILANIAHLLPNSTLEMDSLVKSLRIVPPPFTVAPYGADPAVFLDPDPEPFVQKHGLRDFVLQVGRIEASKNQLLLAYALRDLDLPLVLIGGNMQPQYLEWVKQHGPTGRLRLTIIPHLPPEELRSAYAAAKVHVLPSWIETCGLTTMEAALANCNVVASIAGYELEYYRDLAYYCNPADVASIRQAVLSAYENYDRDANRRHQLKDLILRDYTWPRAAELTKQAYERVLANHP
jgi:glycosyltransferase involved in cell wall biosynthesis